MVMRDLAFAITGAGDGPEADVIVLGAFAA
jgi:hypothetical protein